MLATEFPLEVSRHGEHGYNIPCLFRCLNL